MQESEERKLAAIDQFRLEMARAAQYAKLIDDETGFTDISSAIVQVSLSVGEARDALEKIYKKDGADGTEELVCQGA